MSIQPIYNQFFSNDFACNNCLECHSKNINQRMGANQRVNMCEEERKSPLCVCEKRSPFHSHFSHMVSANGSHIRFFFSISPAKPKIINIKNGRYQTKELSFNIAKPKFPFRATFYLPRTSLKRKNQRKLHNSFCPRTHNISQVRITTLFDHFKRIKKNRPQIKSFEEEVTAHMCT